MLTSKPLSRERLAWEKLYTCSVLPLVGCSGLLGRTCMPRFVYRHVVAIRITNDKSAHACAVVPVRGLVNLSSQLLRASPGRFEIVHREPEQQIFSDLRYSKPPSG